MSDEEALASAIDRVVGVLRQCQSLLFITGAGISADSGLPTYRGIGGLYNVNDTDEGLPIEELLSGEMMRSRPELTWKYLGQIEQAARGARFNRAHEVIAAIETHFPRVWTLTQNVDGFHRLAGSKNVIEIHGNLHHLQCMACDYRMVVDDYSTLLMPPHCPKCRAVLRPDVVLFGELLAEENLARLYDECGAGFDAVFTIGTTSVFPYIAEPVRWARQHGWPTIEINPGISQVSHLVDIRLPMRAASALDAIWQRYQTEGESTWQSSRS
jgi:NAD-dependent deacetylase